MIGSADHAQPQRLGTTIMVAGRSKLVLAVGATTSAVAAGCVYALYKDAMADINKVGKDGTKAPDPTTAEIAGKMVDKVRFSGGQGGQWQEGVRVWARGTGDALGCAGMSLCLARGRKPVYLTCICNYFFGIQI